MKDAKTKITETQSLSSELLLHQGLDLTQGQIRSNLDLLQDTQRPKSGLLVNGMWLDEHKGRVRLATNLKPHEFTENLRPKWT